MVASAPPATALMAAREPAARPRAAATIARRWAVAVSFMRSMTATAVFRAVSTPMESSVWGMSLSIVAGTPTVGMPRLWSSRPPERLPPPPITTSPPHAGLLQDAQSLLLALLELGGAARAQGRAALLD